MAQEKIEIAIGEKKPGIKIKTMKKDLARLRLLEAEEERERIIEVQAKARPAAEKRGEKKAKEELERIRQAEAFRKQAEDSKEPEPIKKPLEKIPPSLEREREPAAALPQQEPPPTKTVELLKRKRDLRQSLSRIIKEEKSVEEQIVQIEEKEKKVTSDKREQIEKKRWQLEARRKEIEKKKWKQRKELKGIKARLKQVDSELIKSRLEKKPVQPEQMPVSPFKEPEQTPPGFEPPSLEKELSPEEKLEQAKKRLGRLRESERKEKRLEKKKPLAETIFKRKAKRLDKEKIFQKSVKIFRPLPPKPSSKKQLLTRFLLFSLILIILAATAGFLYWLIVKKKGLQPPQPPGAEETMIPGEVQPEEASPAPALIPMENERALEIDQPEQLSAILNQMTSEGLNEKFTRIIVKDGTEERFYGLKEFLEAFEVKTPEAFFESLENDFNLFFYSSEANHRLGFLTRLKQGKEISSQMSSWEPSMEKDLEKLLLALGKTEPSLAPYFKQTSFQGRSFRFLTISKDDFGICYAIIDNYFVLTTSFEGMKNAIEKIEAEILREKIGQLFIIGFDGQALTASLEETFKKYQPGGVLLLSKNIKDREQLKKLTRELQELSLRQTGLPLFIAVDQEGGLISRVEFLEEKTPQSQIGNSGQAYQIGLKRGEELKELGINLNLAPVLDAGGQQDFLYDRLFQKSPVETGSLAKSLILGQKAAGVLTSLKHFPGYGGIDFNPEEKLAEKESLPEISQFRTAMEANPEFVMTSNVVYKSLDPSRPFSFSSAGIGFLKNNLGSEGLILSDDLAQNSLLEKFSLEEIVSQPLQAGVDILIFSGWREEASETLGAAYAAAREGKISQAEINEKVSKIIELKQILMASTPPAPPEPNQEPEGLTAWEVFQESLAALRARDLNKVNGLVYKPFDMNDCTDWGFSEEECWNLFESFYSPWEELEESNFVNLEEDQNQILMSTNLTPESDQSGFFQSRIYFVKDPQKGILLLGLFTSAWHFDLETALEAARDTDQDGLTDQAETCTGASQYDPDCVETNPSLKDSDNDGWWDSLELEAETDPNNPQNHL